RTRLVPARQHGSRVRGRTPALLPARVVAHRLARGLPRRAVVSDARAAARAAPARLPGVRAVARAARAARPAPGAARGAARRAPRAGRLRERMPYHVILPLFGAALTTGFVLLGVCAIVPSLRGLVPYGWRMLLGAGLGFLAANLA